MLFVIAIFIGAFLLFQVQPLVAKIILPIFGGGAAIWTACLLFFQGFLLLGYLYAHLLGKIKSLKMQLKLHSGLLFVSLISLPLTPIESRIESTELPLFNILSLLTFSIGLPYLLLASTGPLVQKWFSVVKHDKLPYQLYSLSNAASLIALLSFPFLIEPLLAGSAQRNLWSVGYGSYCLVLLALMYHIAKQQRIKQTISQSVVNKSPLSHVMLWFGLSITGVVLLVATTNAMTQNIPPVPFLWILPLCLYLLSFIISFHSPKWYVRWYWFLLFIPTAIIAILMFFIGSQFSIVTQVVLYSSILFAACMICHGELARLKPCVSQLTWYYLVIATGGFIGSALVAFVAQAVFVQFLEFPLAILAVFVLFSLAVYQAVKQVNKLMILSLSLAIICAGVLWQLNEQYLQSDVFNQRNFYGVLSVKDIQTETLNERRLIDGTTSHGTQSLDIEKQGIPLSYYRKYTGVALALEQFAELNQLERGVNVGLIGLGAGTLAAYGQQDDNYRFYELNPGVINAAQRYFSYLENSRADIAIISGDARVSLTRELSQQQPQNFDVLVIDAFSGDSIPQHLLTVEAMALYWQHLAEDGVIAIHISNSHLNLLPLMQGLAQQTNIQLVYFKTQAEQQHGHDTEWVWLTNNQALLSSGIAKLYQTKVPEKTQSAVVWTDDFSNLFTLLK
ncbi:hypothetical protein tinsulaeT_05650 [Thalassotalea insulae]|uniref:Spermidine synthase n=1 Tax=Thalassotalea insulae TaxID=2056778 RepID=A0ABQ6GRA7_9GAMM|nr:fused MFS/spermidine synthase [Thalassotalea insulae]GLX77225.1 hypothetical protein tinsulaeT_05650 [Thalassotalea insulae]